MIWMFALTMLVPFGWHVSRKGWGSALAENWFDLAIGLVGLAGIAWMLFQWVRGRRNFESLAEISAWGWGFGGVMGLLFAALNSGFWGGWVYLAFALACFAFAAYRGLARRLKI